MLKCIIWDLDDTLWTGTLDTTQPVKLNYHILDYVKKFDALGMIQSIVSKNNYDAATGKLEEYGVSKYFVYPQINYMPKVANISKITDRFQISYDSIAFVDDNEFELYNVKAFLPEITVVSVAEIEQLYGLATEENQSGFSSNHRELMLLREKRLAAFENFQGTQEEFLKACKMKMHVRPGTQDDILRIIELSSRTNKLNNLNSRINYEYVSSLINDIGNSNVFVCELEDIFGFHGIVGVCIVFRSGQTANISFFCISCRVEGRGIGIAFLTEVIQLLIQKDGQLLKVESRYERNSKNEGTLLLLKIIGFHVREADDKGGFVMELDFPYKYKKADWITIK